MSRIAILIALVVVAVVIFRSIKRASELSAQAEEQTKAADKSKIIDLEHDEWAEDERREKHNQ